MGGGAVGMGIGYAAKKLINLVIGVLKVVVALFVGLFIGGLALLEYLGIITVNWDKLYALGPTLYVSITSSLNWVQAQITPLMLQASAAAQTISGNSLLTGFGIGTVAGLYLGVKKAS
jgi:uncharacterized membrane protein (Fun14 family)